MPIEIWLTEKYYEEFHERKDNLFSDAEAIDVYAQTQLLQWRWPGCFGNPPPEIGSKHGLFYVKNDWPGCNRTRSRQGRCSHLSNEARAFKRLIERNRRVV